jgi:hypothetical protein
VAESFQPDDVCSLSQRVAESIATLCPHLPADELDDLATRLALRELAHAADEPSAPGDLVLETTPAGNQVVWLPGASGSAIVLPAGDEPPDAAARAAQLLAWARRCSASLGPIAARGSAAVRQTGAALLSAYQARPRVQ